MEKKRIGQTLIMLLTLIAVSSCSNLDPDSDNPGNYYDPNYYNSENYFMPLMDDRDFANIYGMANDHDNISVIASGNMFEISALPSDIFLAPFPGGSIDAMSNNISVLRDEIPYTHEDYRIVEDKYSYIDYIDYNSYKLSFPEHNMRYRVKQGNDVHTVCMTFGSTIGTTEFRPVGSKLYWVYQFTMTIIMMTVDGVEAPLPEQRSIEYKLYFNRYKDTVK